MTPGRRHRPGIVSLSLVGGKVKDVGSLPLLDLTNLTTDDVEGFLRQAGEVFTVHRGHDSGNTAVGVSVGGRRWFVKWATEPEAICQLESAVRLHTAVRHPAIAALRGWFTFASGLAVVHDWVPGEVLNDPLAPGALPRADPRSAFARFRQIPVRDVLAVYGTVLDAHRAVAERGFVAVDFYDGCLIYDFAGHAIWLCDLDSYRPGPYVLDRDRQDGSVRFMAPEEFTKGATIDERSTVFTLGRTAFVLLSRGQRGEQNRDLWRAGDALFQVATTATSPDPADRYQSVADLIGAWQDAQSNEQPR
jgi:serine/threonine-protein kinase